MAAMAPGGSGSGGGVNPFLSDSDEDGDEVAATEERRAGLRLGAGGDLDPGSAGSLSPQDPMALGSSTRPGLPGEASVSTMALGGTGETPARLSIDAIAAQLLRDQYLLTALELHTELLESGRELPRLRDYFSNPGRVGPRPGWGRLGFRERPASEALEVGNRVRPRAGDSSVSELSLSHGPRVVGLWRVTVGRGVSRLVPS